MKASDILKPYRKAAPVLGYRANAWITLLTLLEAGPGGLSKGDLMQYYSLAGTGAHTALNRWVEKGWLAVQCRKCRGDNGGRPSTMYISTEVLRDFLNDGMDGITPAQILKAYNAVAPVLKKSANLWITFLMLCESSKEGMSRAVLMSYYACNNRKRASLISLWEHAELVTQQSYAPRGNGHGRHRTVYTPTPKLHKFLRVNLEDAA